MSSPADLGTDLFGYKINYNQVEGLSIPHSDFPSLLVKPKYNGNIAEISWKTLTEENEPLKRYGYVYDNLNRLNAGFYQKAGAENAQEYYERLEYDLNGNITRLQRSEGLAPGSNTAMRIDNLKYDYMGNRLTKVTEEQIGNSNGYPYLASHNTIEYDNNLSDGNGNMTKHLDKGINAIIYNYLNLPSQIARGSGRRTNISSYTYRADGTKLKKTISTGNVFSNSETDYLDGFQYDNKNGFSVLTPVLKFVPTSEGYFDFEKNQYIYNYVDHLGNVRIGYSDSNGDNFIQPRDLSVQHCEDMGDGNIACFNDWVPGEVVEVNNYYPFGLMHNYAGTTLNNYQYKYNGKELQETGMYDYGARMYMPDIGRWGVIDPLAEKYRRWTPYNYVMNNPIRFIDPDGMRASTDEYSQRKDIIKIMNNGKIERTPDNNPYDTITNEDGSASIKIDRTNVSDKNPTGDSQIGGQKTLPFETPGHDGVPGGTEYSYLKIDNNDVAQQFFEFAAENTGVEFTRDEFSFSDGFSSNIIGTNHSANESISSYYVIPHLNLGGNSFHIISETSGINYDHSHPFGSNIAPSGFSASFRGAATPSFYKIVTGSGDYLMGGREKFNALHVYSSWKYPSPGKGYIKYDGNNATFVGANKK
ncbi:RHS repeat-associated core domain-containing protein [Chryseobacterium luquanense]|uniref:RHS repeat-associated core domain-containing protein n=1 Tax=Chryseobacterium luquanense TaxID=2983766 RepID=A0ABT3Y1R3_9FLAO|nr:RHS repeat-associated core domain-containing protein [Chryseobacterium luquanense]MCX8532073.1 hypothetical protein [Chryseobacterium luquanense]